MRRYRIETCNNLSDSSSDAWTEIVQKTHASIFYSYSWLKAYERAGPHQSQPYHLLAYSGTELVGLLPVYLTRGCPRLTAHRKYLVRTETSLHEPMLLAHSFYSYYGGPLIREGHDGLLSELLVTFQNLAHDLGVQVYGFVNVPHDAESFLASIKQHGFITRYISSSMYLPITWSSFDEYVAALPVNHRFGIRKAMRRMRNRGYQLSCEFVAEPENFDELIVQLEQILKKHKHIDTNLYPIAYLKAIASTMGEAAKFALVRGPNNQLLCFGLVLDDGRCLTPWVAGIDYDTLKIYDQYHFLCRWLLRYAIENEYEEIDMGRGSYRFKSRYGFKRRILNMAIKTPQAELRSEVDRWSREMAETNLARYARHFADKEV